VPGGYVDNAIAATKYFCEPRPVQNRSFNKHRFLFQIPWSTNIQDHWCITFVEQHGYEGLAEISGPSGQKHFHCFLPTYPLFARQYAWRQGRFVRIE
jgi:hypothetical protein